MFLQLWLILHDKNLKGFFFFLHTNLTSPFKSEELPKACGCPAFLRLLWWLWTSGLMLWKLVVLLSFLKNEEKGVCCLKKALEEFTVLFPRQQRRPRQTKLMNILTSFWKKNRLATFGDLILCLSQFLPLVKVRFAHPCSLALCSCMLHHSDPNPMCPPPKIQLSLSNDQAWCKKAFTFIHSFHQECVTINLMIQIFFLQSAQWSLLWKRGHSKFDTNKMVVNDESEQGRVLAPSLLFLSRDVS